MNQEEIKVVKDEVLLLDARHDGTCSDYKNKRQMSWCKGIMEKTIMREVVTEGGYCMCAPALIISNSIIRSRYAINLFVDESFTENNEIPNVYGTNDVNGEVYYQMIQNFEKTFDEIVQIVRKAKHNHSDHLEAAWLEAVCKIADKFWRKQGVNMMEIADIPYPIRWETLIGDTLLLQDNVIDDFVAIVRKGVQNWRVREKRYGEGNPEEISYDGKWLYVPTAILNRILSSYGIKSGRKYLVEMRERGYLKVDSATSLSRQIQVGKIKVEMYQMCRDIFNRPGLPDIVDLGKEEVDD